MKKLSVIFVLISVLTACKPAENNKLSPGSNPGNESRIIVEAKKIEYVKFEHFFSVNGSVEAIKEAFISPEISGQIKTVHVSEGDRVKKDQLLISLNSDVTEHGITEIKTSLKLAKTVFEKRKGLWDKKIGSEIQFLQAQTNKESLENKLKTLEARLEKTKIKAPIAGIVDQISKKQGELAIPGSLLIRVIDLRKVYANADVSEAYLSKIHKGDPVFVTFPSYPELGINASILRVANVVNPQNRTFQIKIKINNENEKLKPNIIAVIKIKDFSAESAFVVPSIIIKKDFKGTYLYVVERGDVKLTARKIHVETGMSEKGNTMITKGLEPGLEVITGGYNLVKNGVGIKLK
ncbi:MAG: efflux RND transporter periplasmic adaptor subunit [Candidatus Aminicenantes bacterium]|nr:efflux RND transporter periplasmic adaptor subunit [Candidatus Aminicenantes bacterium]